MIDELIDELVRTGRDITDEELRHMRRVVADTGFGSTAVARAGDRVAGSMWQGRMIMGNELLPNGVRHYLFHVVVREEWPRGTTFEEYAQSLRTTVLDDHGAVSLEQVGNFNRLTFLSATGSWRGPGGSSLILVGYNIEYGYWSTGYQPEPQYVSAIQEERPGMRWLRPLT